MKGLVVCILTHSCGYEVVFVFLSSLRKLHFLRQLLLPRVCTFSLLLSPCCRWASLTMDMWTLYQPVNFGPWKRLTAGRNALLSAVTWRVWCLQGPPTGPSGPLQPLSSWLTKCGPSDCLLVSRWNVSPVSSLKVGCCLDEFSRGWLTEAFLNCSV